MEAKKTNMEYRRLGQTGLKVSLVSYGNMVNWDPANIDRDLEIIKFLVDNGVNFIDTAEMYENGKAEIQLGNILKKLNVPRADLVISTKIFGMWGGVNNTGSNSRKHIIEGALDSLKRLQLDYADILFSHRHDPETPVEEVCRAMNWLVNNNKCFYWGTSEWPVAAIVEAHAVCDRLGLIHPIVEQVGYNMFQRQQMEVNYAPLFDKFGTGTTIWSPLAGGILTGKYNNGIPEGSRFATWGGMIKELFFDPMMGDKVHDINSKKLQQLGEIAKELGGSQTQLALAWTLKNKDVSTAIIGGKSVEQVKESLGALELYKKITPEIEERIEKILDNRPAPPFNWKSWSPFPPRR